MIQKPDLLFGGIGINWKLQMQSVNLRWSRFGIFSFLSVQMHYANLPKCPFPRKRTKSNLRWWGYLCHSLWEFLYKVGSYTPVINKKTSVRISFMETYLSPNQSSSFLSTSSSTLEDQQPPPLQSTDEKQKGVKGTNCNILNTSL